MRKLRFQEGTQSLGGQMAAWSPGSPGRPPTPTRGGSTPSSFPCKSLSELLRRPLTGPWPLCTAALPVAPRLGMGSARHSPTLGVAWFRGEGSWQSLAKPPLSAWVWGARLAWGPRGYTGSRACAEGPVHPVLPSLRPLLKDPPHPAGAGPRRPGAQTLGHLAHLCQALGAHGPCRPLSLLGTRAGWGQWWR